MKEQINKSQSTEAKNSANKGFIQIIKKNNGKLVDFGQKDYTSVELMNDDYGEFMRHYTKEYLMHHKDDKVSESFGEGLVELKMDKDMFAFTNRLNNARKIAYRIGDYSVDVYKVEFLD